MTDGLPRRRITVATTSRADFGIYAPVVEALRESANLAPDLLVSGAHVPAEMPPAARQAAALRLADEAAIPLAGHIPMPQGSGDAASVAQAMAAVSAGAATRFAAGVPDILLVLGDRYEMHAIVSIASAFRIPVAHVHGGEESVGALDNAYRHSISKLSHLHFCATDLSARRLRAMGEEAWRITVTGAPALDGIDRMALLPRADLMARLGLPDAPFLLGTFHPETVSVEETVPHFEILIAALAERGLPTVFSRANADEAGQRINERLEAAAARHPWLHIRDSLGRHVYFSAMRHAEALVGNSSSGIIEAASFGLPVLNVGDRQGGRERSANVVDASSREGEIRSALDRVLSPDFRQASAGTRNVYFKGGAGVAIRAVLERQPLGRTLLAKSFQLDAP